jgi:hypothetical protein
VERVVIRKLVGVATLLLLASPAWAVITLDQHTQTDNGGTAATTCVASLTGVSNGDLLTAEISGGVGGGGTGTFTSAADNVNGTYSAGVAAHKNATINQWYGIYYFANASTSGGALTLTITWSESISYAACSFEAWKGAATSSVLDSSFSQQQDATATANPTTGSNQPPSAAGELIIAATGYNADTPTAGASYTLIDGNNSTLYYPEYWIQTTATATNGPFTAASDDWTDQMAAFKASGAAPTCTPTLALTGVGKCG